MALKMIENTLILSGDVKQNDLSQIKDAFIANAAIDLVILRNSHGGDAWTGYRVGELFREKNVTTAVSGYCISSCSRMFLGGKKRIFTDDYTTEKTYIGFHGHYVDGRLSTRSVAALGLYDWIVKYSDGKADPELVRRWINIELANGMVAFMRAATYFCNGTEIRRPLGCEKISTNAMERGVVTELAYVSSPDQQSLPERVRAKIFPASGYAELHEITQVPLASVQGIENYKRYLAANAPKAFAVSLTKWEWAWNSGDENANELALQRCAERAKQACVLYAVDEAVVFKP